MNTPTGTEVGRQRNPNATFKIPGGGCYGWDGVKETREMGAKIISLKGWSAHHAPGAGLASGYPGFKW